MLVSVLSISAITLCGLPSSQYRKVGGVHRVVEEHADVLFGADVPRGGAVGQIGVEQKVDAVAAAQRTDASHGATFDPFLNLLVEWVAAHLKRHLEMHAAFIDGFDDAVAIVARRCHRLLA
jgi:hypothetical protein